MAQPLHHVDRAFEKATFGMGCYWGADSLFGVKHGVLRTCVGYAAGTTEAPKSKQLGDHVEVIEIQYDPTEITYSELLEMFWKNHEYRSSARLKREYMTLIMYHNEDQRRLAEASKAKQQTEEGNELIATEIVPEGPLYPAESRNQKYRLQGHVDLVEELRLTPELLKTSHVAARLNGYLAGLGGLKQFQQESDKLGLSEKQVQYVRNFLIQNEGAGLSC
ncbi:peptide methionine sulfoxide reductase-like [Sabethes cyaneus]|uniref:peptide methionine sulfoxide reductase-like n=1 Tax=Sabethes cyaneus TaxID=53552 RepID=UPI00237EA22D|nr:peptide methionine sulfoxide reductase-like [Sabethes cyaneus]XP_053688398.1 peptide methionine sulfoxide reductase-like [Sabethes cyaneus]